MSHRWDRIDVDYEVAREIRRFGELLQTTPIEVHVGCSAYNLRPVS